MIQHSNTTYKHYYDHSKTKFKKKKTMDFHEIMNPYSVSVVPLLQRSSGLYEQASSSNSKKQNRTYMYQLKQICSSKRKGTKWIKLNPIKLKLWINLKTYELLRTYPRILLRTTNLAHIAQLYLPFFGVWELVFLQTDFPWTKSIKYVVTIILWPKKQAKSIFGSES